MKENMIITKHAYLRSKERLGLNKKATNRIAEKVLEQGVNIDNSYGRLNEYIEKQNNKYSEDFDTYIYGEVVYIFHKVLEKLVLVTMYLLPNELKKIASVYIRKINVA